MATINVEIQTPDVTVKITGRGEERQLRAILASFGAWADSPGGVSGRILGSPAERSEDGNQGSTAGQSRVPRRSEAEPGNKGRTCGEPAAGSP